MSEEEIINVIETVIRANRFDGVYTSVDIILESMKGLLDLYNILKEKYNFTINNNLDDKYEEVLEKTFKKYLDKDFISKDKIREIRDRAEVMDYYTLNTVIDDLSKLIGDEEDECRRNFKRM